jgi:TfoX/Sxy family transcriptional regulator of competence genes
MAYDQRLADRIRRLLGERTGFEERKMFGGLAFMVRGHMCCGLVKDDLMVKVGKQAYPEAIARPHARVMDFTGRPSTGMVYVAPAGLKTERALAAWLDRGLAHVRTLPPRPVRPRKLGLPRSRAARPVRARRGGGG